MSKEIERKFFISSLPDDLEIETTQSIVQGYIAYDKSGIEIRIRVIDNDKYYLTFKNKGDLMRDELEIELYKDQFDKLWEMTKGLRLYKKRSKILLDNFVIEIDEYEKKLNGLKIVEVEFDSIEQSEKFTPPHWFGEEITYNDNYKNYNLALTTNNNS